MRPKSRDKVLSEVIMKCLGDILIKIFGYLYILGSSPSVFVTVAQGMVSHWIFLSISDFIFISKHKPHK
jgi:hypothetical protein